MTTTTWPDPQHEAAERRREGGRRGGRATAAALSPAERQWRASAGAKASRSPLAHARALAAAWDGMTRDEREEVSQVLAKLRREAVAKALTKAYEAL